MSQLTGVPQKYFSSVYQLTSHVNGSPEIFGPLISNQISLNKVVHTSGQKSQTYDWFSVVLQQFLVKTHIDLLHNLPPIVPTEDSPPL